MRTRGTEGWGSEAVAGQREAAMEEMGAVLTRWQLDVASVRERIYRATSPREREWWHAVWLLARGWNVTQVAEALARDVHTVGEWAAVFRKQGPAGLMFTQSGGAPPPSPPSSRPL
jgi:Homeodomain-like domain